MEVWFSLALLCLSVTQWTRSVHSCPISNGTLPLRTRLVDTNSNQVLRPGETVTITCAVDCGQTDYTGCNIIDDWAVIGINRWSDESRQYYISHDSDAFRTEGGVYVSFDGALNEQREMCTGTPDTEQFSLNITASNTPKFKTIYVFCGLGRSAGRQNRTPVLRVYNFDYIAEINVTTPTTSTFSSHLSITVTSTVTSLPPSHTTIPAMPTTPSLPPSHTTTPAMPTTPSLPPSHTTTSACVTVTVSVTPSPETLTCPTTDREVTIPSLSVVFVVAVLVSAISIPVLAVILYRKVHNKTIKVKRIKIAPSKGH